MIAGKVFRKTAGVASALTVIIYSSFPTWAQQQQMPPAQVQVVEAQERLMAPQMDVTGSVISLNDSRVSAEVEGPLKWIAEVGTPVQEGDVIARIDDRLLKIAHERAKANLNRLQADMTFRNQDVKRFEELAAKDNASRARLEEVLARRDMLAHEISDAEATLERAKGDLARTEIRAPFPGHVVERLANKGEYMTVGKEVARLVDTQNMEVVMPAPISIVPYLEKGKQVGVRDARGMHNLPIRTVVPVGDRVSRMVEVRLSVPKEGWVVGTPVKVSLPKGEAKRAIAVPRDALVFKGNAVFVYRVKEDMTAEQIDADIGDAVGLWVSIGTEGVAAGDNIVVRGAERLQPGQPVQVDETLSAAYSQ